MIAGISRPQHQLRGDQGGWGGKLSAKKKNVKNKEI